MTSIAQRSAPISQTAVHAPAWRRAVAVMLVLASAGATAVAVAVADRPTTAALAGSATVLLWAVCAALVAARRPGEPVGLLLASATAVGAAGVLGAATRAAGNDAMGEALVAACLAALPAFGVHIVIALPDGRLVRRFRRSWVWFFYALAVVVALLVWGADVSPWLVVGSEAVLAVFVAGAISSGRYHRTRGLDRQRMQWFGVAVTLGAILATVSAAFALLLGWPNDARIVLAIAAAPVPLSFVLATSHRWITRVDRLLGHTVSVGGLTALIVVVYVVVVLGLGRVPTRGERTLLLLSMTAAALAALLYVPTRDRLHDIATRLVYGERHAPDEVLRTFGSRMSRAVPLDELLLQMAESLRKTFDLDAVEVWTGKEGTLERFVSDPERGHARMRIGNKELPVLTRAGISGPAWIRVWLPELLQGREDSMLRIAPITHQGELLGMVTVERRNSADVFGEEEERVLTELARTVGIALHNVQLDTALQASLDELRTQAEELRRSRERIVAAGDEERRKLERNLHDGAQQRLVALAVKINLVKNLMNADADTAGRLLGELGSDLQEAIQELRDLAHGIFPKVLVDRGLVAGLESIASKAALPTEVEAAGVGRYRQDVEAAIYFVCSEALQNAGKHAGAGASARIRLHEDAGALLFEVTDDGAGFDLSSKGLGAGFTNMDDRVGAVGGTLTVTSTPNRGTTISGRIPVESARVPA